MNVNDSEDKEEILKSDDLPEKGNKASEQWSKFIADERVQALKKNGGLYFCYFIDALAHPYRSMKSSENTGLKNAAITIGLVLLLSALYCFTWFCKLGFQASFTHGLLKPLVLTAIGLAAAFGLSYAVLRMEKIKVCPKVLMSRFAILLSPSVLCLLLAALSLLMGMLVFSLWLQLIAYLFIFVGMNVLILQYPLNAEPRAIDSFYVIVAANAIMGYIFYKIISSVFLTAMGGFGIF